MKIVYKDQKKIALMQLTLCIFVFLYSANARSADIVRNVTTANTGLEAENGGYFALGIALMAWRGTWLHRDERITDTGYNSSELVIAWDYRYKGVFVEAEWGSLDGINLGYTAWSNDTWSADILYSLASSYQIIGSDTSESANPDREESLRNELLLYDLADRQYIQGVGLRITGLMGDYIVQYRLLEEVSHAQGLYSSLRVGRSWEMKNGLVYALGSLEYYSKDVNDYLYGVDELEATKRFPVYSAGAGGRVSVKLGMTYPLSEHWVADASLLLASTAKAERRSPLTSNNRYIAIVGMSIRYVFEPL